MAKPDQDWEKYLHDNILLYRLLPKQEQEALHHRMNRFIARKYWEGCHGLQISTEIQVTIAAQACLLLLGFDNYLFDELKTILVYPGGFLALDDDPLGAEDTVQQVIGLAHHAGPVVLSWWDARWDGRRLGSRNVVLHEFAHKLAELGDPETGTPPLDDADLESRWEEVVSEEFERLREDADYGRPSLLDPYGATHRAEFFAVATESFFLQPVALRDRHPQLYQLLADYYRQEPALRPVSAALADQQEAVEEEYARHTIAECNAALDQCPDYVDAYRIRAGLFLQLGEIPPALADWTAVIRLAASKEVKGNAYHRRGLVQLEAEAWDDALADFNEAIRLCPDTGCCYGGRGAAHAKRGDLPQALADLNHALRLDPRDDTALLRRARIHRDQGKPLKALRDLSRALRLSPFDPDIWITRAAVRLNLREYDAAVTDCDEALRLAPHLAEAFKQRGVVHFHNGNLEQALADLSEAIRLDPDNREAYQERAAVHVTRGEPDLASHDRTTGDRLGSEQGD